MKNYKLTKKDKALLRRYGISISNLLDEAETMTGQRSLNVYIDSVEECIGKVRSAWPVKNIESEMIAISHIFQKVEGMDSVISYSTKKYEEALEAQLDIDRKARQYVRDF